MPKPHAEAMSSKEYDDVLEELGLTRAAAAKHLGISLRAAVGYANDDYAVPIPTAKLLRLWLDIKRRHIRSIVLPF